MDTFTIIVGAVLEFIALVFIVRLWTRRPLKLVPCLLWSGVLLVPFFGILIYVFLRETPEAHPDRVPDTYHTGSSSAGDGHGH
jgi:hypothetical protein